MNPTYPKNMALIPDLFFNSIMLTSMNCKKFKPITNKKKDLSMQSILKKEGIDYVTI